MNNGSRLLVLSVGSVWLAAGCAAEPGELEVDTRSAAATFDWGADCEAGSGVFDAAIPFGDTVVIGTIPVNKRDVTISLRAPTDVDVQLVDEASGDEIIAWPGGLLSGPNHACATYRSVEYCYSGYNGYDADGDGARELGSEKIEIHGVTNRALVMRAFGYRSGDAVVRYAWSPANTCNEKGQGEFSQSIPLRDTVVVGDIPANKVNVFIELEAEGGRDVDVQLIDAVSGTEIVAWPNGLLHGPIEARFDYQGMTITYSGYNGRHGNWGLEDIRIDGRVTRPLIMRAFGYQRGVAQIRYRWGEGAGDACGARGLAPCRAALTCKDGDHGNIAADVPGECHTETWCESPASAAADCAALAHIAVPGEWTCAEFACRWQPRVPGAAEGEMCGGIAGIACASGLACWGLDPAVADAAGTCRKAGYCEVATVDRDCSAQVHPAVPGSWGCDANACTWLAQTSVDRVSFDALRASPVTYADGRVVQVTWSVDARTGAGDVSEVLGTAPVDPPPLGPGGDFVILNGVTCTGAQCDFDRGSWVTAFGRIGVLQGGHILMNVLRADAAKTCSTVSMACPVEMHCQIGIGCPTPGNCGINPPGMCLEN